VASPEAHPGLAAVARLQRIGAALAAGKPATADDAQWMATGVRRYLRAAPDGGAGLDEALGLAPRPGQWPWWRVASMAKRDELIRQLAEGIDGKPAAKVIDLQQRMRNYRSTSWIRDRRSGTSSSANALLLQIFSLYADPPTGATELRKILNGRDFARSAVLTEGGQVNTPDR
jgi:hypothetical protein